MLKYIASVKPDKKVGFSDTKNPNFKSLNIFCSGIGIDFLKKTYIFW